MRGFPIWPPIINYLFLFPCTDGFKGSFHTAVELNHWTLGLKCVKWHLGMKWGFLLDLVLFDERGVRWSSVFRVNLRKTVSWVICSSKLISAILRARYNILSDFRIGAQDVIFFFFSKVLNRIFIYFTHMHVDNSSGMNLDTRFFFPLSLHFFKSPK